jgi:putative transposase
MYPNKSQQELLTKHFWCVRFVYNRWLSLSQEKYPWYNTLARQLTQYKKEKPFLSEVLNHSLQYSLKHLDSAFKSFFNKKWKYPKFKKKWYVDKVHYTENIHIKYDKVKVPKIWYIKCKFHRPCLWKIKSMCITKTASWKYYVSILTDNSERKPSWVWKVGIDMWIKEFAILSDWTVYHNPKYLKKSQKRLKRLQKVLSRKKKGSSNRSKARLKLARQYEKVSNQRLDFQHKVSREIANKYWFVAMEKLNIKWMMKNHKLAGSISDAGWYMFKKLLSYKTKVVEIDQYEPSSKTCSNCWNVKQNLTLQDRTYHCDVCGYVEDRDVNAAKNILTMANI